MQVLYIFFILILAYFFFNRKTENFETGCNNQSSAENQLAQMGETAKDACNRISSKAEEIEAHYEGAAKVVDAAWAFLSPKNYKSGDNKTTDMMRNIINSNLSECDIKKIANDCKNTSMSVQSNEIDNTQCKYCETNLCTISNVSQKNISKISQTCTIQSAIETLMSKKTSVDAQALAKVLQKAQGILSGNNNYKKENCNIVSNDLSSVSYIEEVSKCANNLKTDQDNALKFCGNVTNIIQENQYDAFQNCLLGTAITKKTDMTSDTEIKHEGEVTQETTGLDLSASLASITSISWVAIGISALIVIILSSVFLTPATTSAFKK